MPHPQPLWEGKDFRAWQSYECPIFVPTLKDYLFFPDTVWILLQMPFESKKMGDAYFKKLQMSSQSIYKNLKLEV